MELYDKDIAILKKFREDYYRIVLFNTLPKLKKDLEAEADSEKGENVGGHTGTGQNYDNTFENIPKSKIRGKNDEKLYASLARSRARIREIAICNNWEYFITMTIDGAKHSRNDLSAFRKKLSKWLNNYNTKMQSNVKYLLIPETHKDGINWHLHGLLMGLPESHLREFTLDEKLPHYMRKLLKQGRKLYDWSAYSTAFGWVSAEKIQSSEGVAHYITKYITKNLGSQIELNQHVYFCSKGLKRAEVICRGKLAHDLGADYVNEHLKIKTFRGSLGDALGYFGSEVGEVDCE